MYGPENSSGMYGPRHQLPPKSLESRLLTLKHNFSEAYDFSTRFDIVGRIERLPTDSAVTCADMMLELAMAAPSRGAASDLLDRANIHLDTALNTDTAKPCGRQETRANILKGSVGLLGRLVLDGEVDVDTVRQTYFSNLSTAQHLLNRQNYANRAQDNKRSVSVRNGLIQLSALLLLQRHMLVSGDLSRLALPSPYSLHYPIYNQHPSDIDVHDLKSGDKVSSRLRILFKHSEFRGEQPLLSNQSLVYLIPDVAQTKLGKERFRHTTVPVMCLAEANKKQKPEGSQRLSTTSKRLNVLTERLLAKIS